MFSGVSTSEVMMLSFRSREMEKKPTEITYSNAVWLYRSLLDMSIIWTLRPQPSIEAEVLFSFYQTRAVWVGWPEFRM